MICVSISPSRGNAEALEESTLPPSLTYIPGSVLGMKDPMSVVILVRMGGALAAGREGASKDQAPHEDSFTCAGDRRVEATLSALVFDVVRWV
jgi:hypothetical protein